MAIEKGMISMATNNINNANANVKVNGTSNDDYIYNNAHHVTINAGLVGAAVEGANLNVTTSERGSHITCDNCFVGTTKRLVNHQGTTQILN